MPLPAPVPVASPFARAVAGVCLLVLAGCASLAPDRERVLPAVAVPGAWSSADTATATTPGTGAAPAAPAAPPTTLSATWWTRFDDPHLTALVEKALAANTDVRSAVATLRQARALREQAAAGLVPRADVSASAQRSKSEGQPASSLYRAGFDASWEPDIFGANRSAVAAAEANTLATAASLENTRVSIAAEVAVGYIQLRGFQARLAIAQENLKRQEETQQITEWRVQAGLTTSLDLEQARAATAQTRAQIPTLAASVAQTEHSLALLTGQAPGALVALLAQPLPIPTAPEDLALSIPADTLRQRPDVYAAEQDVIAAAARLNQAEAAKYPSVRLSGSIGLSALTLGSLTSGGTLASAILGSIAWPLFDGGATRATIEAQDAAFERARVDYEAAVLVALRDVEDALVQLSAARERLASLRQALDAARNAALLADNRYASGLIDFQTVLDTQRTLLSAQDNVAATETELGASYVRLYKALGGGWQPETLARTTGNQS